MIVFPTVADGFRILFGITNERAVIIAAQLIAREKHTNLHRTFNGNEIRRPNRKNLLLSIPGSRPTGNKECQDDPRTFCEFLNHITADRLIVEVIY